MQRATLLSPTALRNRLSATLAEAFTWPVSSSSRWCLRSVFGRCLRLWLLHESCEDIVDQSFDLVGGQDRRNGHAGGCRPQWNAIAFNLGIGALQPSWHGRVRTPAAHDLRHRRFVVLDAPEARPIRVVAAVAALSHAAVTIGARGPEPGVLAGSEARIVLGQRGDSQSDTGGKRQDAAAQIATHANHFSTCAMDGSWGMRGGA